MFSPGKMIIMSVFWLLTTTIAAFTGWWIAAFLALTFKQWFAIMTLAQVPVNLVLVSRDFAKQLDDKIEKMKVDNDER